MHCSPSQSSACGPPPLAPGCHVETAIARPRWTKGQPRGAEHHGRENRPRAALQPGRRRGCGTPRHQDLHPGSAAPGPSQEVAGAAPGHCAPLGQLCGPAPVREAPQFRGVVQAAGAQRGVFPEQLRPRLPRPHPLLPHHLPPAPGGSGRLLRGLLPRAPANPAVPAGAVWPGAQHGAPVRTGRGCLLPLLLAGGGRIRCLLGAGCGPGGDWLPRCLARAGVGAG